MRHQQNEWSSATHSSSLPPINENCWPVKTLCKVQLLMQRFLRECMREEEFPIDRLWNVPYCFAFSCNVIVWNQKVFAESFQKHLLSTWLIVMDLLFSHNNLLNPMSVNALVYFSLWTLWSVFSAALSFQIRLQFSFMQYQTYISPIVLVSPILNTMRSLRSFLWQCQTHDTNWIGGDICLLFAPLPQW